MLKLAREGYPFISIAAAVTAAAFIFGGGWAAALPLLLTIFIVYFFRDPERNTPPGDNLYISPADGRILQIQTVTEEKYLKGRAVEVSIFMSPLNVHVNRAPCAGVVESVVYTPGAFISAFKPEASIRNENIAMLLKGKDASVLVRQVAGAVARRVVCRVSPGVALRQGERYGIIKFSSRLDVYLPEDTAITVSIGDTVRAGETIIGKRSI
ncbi:MAG: phosphatidylserine decarboxylase family protein [Nitrospirae bacterium]|nr:phosphatidylserine decarboxylase family protein [Nitrospirota bacterium]